jgi:uncharacterized repeat protein (TIGR03803 family)
MRISSIFAAIILYSLSGAACRADLEASLSVLASFSGADPSRPLIQGSDGWFYGSNSQGGSNNLGMLFKVSSSGTFTDLHDFTGGDDGAAPSAALIEGADGNYYGAASGGGSNSCYGGCGTLFKITPDGAFTTLHVFTGIDNLQPGDLLQANDGFFYGSDVDGLFRFDSDGDFTNVSTIPGATIVPGYGIYPWNGLLRGWDGNFYGLSSQGGTNQQGTAFRVSAAGVTTLLVDFAGSDISNPTGPLIQGADGNFYAVSFGGGDYGFGNVFQMTPAGTTTDLYSFTGSDGIWPQTSLVQGDDGRFYGMISDISVYVYQLSVTIDTSGSGCVSVDPATITFSASGGPGQINVTASDGCNWFVVDTNDFIVIMSAGGGSGTGVVDCAVAPNNSLIPRSGVITVNTHPVTITQLGFNTFGAFAGLISQSNQTASTGAGEINLVLDDTAAFNGSLVVNGERGTFTGRFDDSGSATNTVTPAKASPLQLALQLDTVTAANQIIGTVSSTTFTSQVLAVSAPFSRTNLCPWAGNYVFLLQLTDTNSDYGAYGPPYGYGFGLLTVAPTGVASLKGFLNNSARFTATGSVSASGVWPFYGAGGSGIGWVQISSNTSIASPVIWLTSYYGGTVVDFIGTPSVSASPFIGSATVTLSGGFMPTNLVKNISIDSRGRVTVLQPGDDNLKLKVQESTGEFSGSFWDGSASTSCSISGKLLPNLGWGAGFFSFGEGLDETGSIVIQLDQ